MAGGLRHGPFLSFLSFLFVAPVWPLCCAARVPFGSPLPRHGPERRLRLRLRLNIVTRTRPRKVLTALNKQIHLWTMMIPAQHHSREGLRLHYLELKISRCFVP